MRPRLSTIIRTPAQLVLLLILNFTFWGSIFISGFLPILRVPKIFPGMVGEGVPLCTLGSIGRSLTAWWPLAIILVFIGILILIGVLVGRGLCGWACPIGFLQDLFSHAKAAVGIPPKEPPTGVHRNLIALKFAILVLLVLLSISIGASYLASGVAGTTFRGEQPGMVQTSPACSYCITPSIRAVYDIFAFNRWSPNDPIFLLQASVVGIFFAFAMVTPRAWCRYLCPVGALSSLFNGFSMLHLSKEQDKCTRNCYVCYDVCPTRCNKVRDEATEERVSDTSCIFCMKCVDACPEDCLHIKFGSRTLYSGGKRWKETSRPKGTRGRSRTRSKR